MSDHVLPIVFVDYVFMSESQSAGDESGMPILVARDLNSEHCGSGMLFACVAMHKGVNPYVVKSLSNFIA